MIREGKRVVVEDVGGPSGGRRCRDSLGWYNSCVDTAEFCSHRSSDGEMPMSFQPLPIMGIVTHVLVLRAVLGLSLGVGSDDMMFGEVTREFEHAVTKLPMYKVAFGEVLGVQTVAKSSCQNAFKVDGPPKSDQVQQWALESDPEEVVVPTRDNTFTLELPKYLDCHLEDSSDSPDDPEWEADFVDWQGGSDSGNSDWALSEVGDEPLVVEDSLPEAPDIPFESLRFKHRYAPMY